MANESSPKSHPITDKAALVEYLEAGCKPEHDWRIGTEHEKFAYDLKTLRPLTYDGKPGVCQMLDALTRFGWTPVMEHDNVIALSKPDRSSISLEPAGQLELSGAPVKTIHQTCGEVTEHLKQVKEIAGELGIGFLGLGYNPKWPRATCPGCPRTATRSCATTCRPRARSAST